MAVPNTNCSILHTENGVTTTFAFDFVVLQSSDLRVTSIDLNGNESEISPDNYTVSGVGLEGGGSITKAAGINNYKLRIERVVDLTQLTRFRNLGQFSAESHESAFDHLAMIGIQQQKQIDRCAQLSVGVGPVGPLPTPVSGSVLGWVSGAWAWLSGASVTLAANLLTYARGFGTDLVGYLAPYVGAVGRLLYLKLSDAINAADFGAVADGSDQTSKVQAALNALDPNKGGLVAVNQGVKFNLNALTFPKRSNLEYFRDSDTSAPGPSSGIGTNERVHLAANANDNGIVNEWRFTAPFHPGLGIDVRKDVLGHNAFHGAGQTQSAPARASFNIYDEQTSAWSVLYQAYDTWTDFSGTGIGGYRRTVRLNGIGTTQWTSVAPENTVITGQTSGAKGFLLSVTSTYTLVLWISGKFVVGEKLIDNNETTTATVTSVTYTEATFKQIMQDLKRGNWSVGCAPGSTRDVWTVGGKSAVQQMTRAATWYTDKLVMNPAFVLLDSYENATPAGFELTYDCTPAAAYRRVTLRKYATATDWVTGTAYVSTNTVTYQGTIYRCLANHTAGTFTTDLAAGKWIADDYGHVGAVKAHTGFGNAGGTGNVSSYNVSGITHDSTGTYTITFKTPFARADYQVCLTTGSAVQYAIAFNKSTTALVVKVYTTGTSTLVDLTADLDVIIVGGDI